MNQISLVPSLKLINLNLNKLNLLNLLYLHIENPDSRGLMSNIYLVIIKDNLFDF